MTNPPTCLASSVSRSPAQKPGRTQVVTEHKKPIAMAYTIDGDDVLLAILDGVEQRHGLWSAGSSADAGEPHFSEPGDVSSSSESSSSR